MALIACVLATVAAGATAASASVRASSTVAVGAREYRFALDRPAVPRGTVRLDVHDVGAVAHDLQVVGPHGYRSAVSADVRPGESLTLAVRLRRPGVYTLLCRKPGHLAAGMRAQLRVR